MRIGHALSLALVVSSLGSVACSSPANEESVTGEAEGALVAVHTGHFAVDSAPLSGSYIAELTLKAGKKFDMEYVRVTSTSEPWLWNPWIQVPSSKKESMLLSGSYMTFKGDPGETLISFDPSEGSVDHLIYKLESVSGGGMRLTAIGESPFELVPGSAAPPASDTRVVRCTGHGWNATFTFDDPGRRRGTMKVKRTAGADASDPPSGSVTVVYDGDTGVDDYMGFQGADAKGGRYELAFRRSELDHTSGPTSEVGLGYSKPDTDYFMHNTLTCSIATE